MALAVDKCLQADIPSVRLGSIARLGSASRTGRTAGVQKILQTVQNSMQGSVRSHKEPISAIFSALRGYRPRKIEQQHVMCRGVFAQCA